MARAKPPSLSVVGGDPPSGPGTSATSWRDNLILTDTGKAKPLIANALQAFRLHPDWAGSLWFDSFHLETVFKGPLPWCEAPYVEEKWTHKHDVLATEWLQHMGVHVSVELAGTAIEAISREHTFHPVLDYLASLEWDGTPRLDNWAIKYLGAEPSPYTRAVAAKWMISAVARVSNPGHKVDHALVLEGPQGIRKSTALRVLGDPWFTDQIPDLGSKDSSQAMSGVWILELAELSAVRGRETERVKAFMTVQSDRYRPPYAKRPISAPRQCVFAASTNDQQWLDDPTGGRRFWPMPCTTIDIPGLSDIKDQLWAEAARRHYLGEACWLDDKAIERAAQDQQRERYQGDPWQGPIEAYLDPRNRATIAEILKDALFKPIPDTTRADQMRVSSCLKSLGWTRHRTELGDGSRPWCWFRPADTEPNQAARDEVDATLI